MRLAAGDDAEARLARRADHPVDPVDVSAQAFDAVGTVRVIIPGTDAYCFDRTRKGDRLYGAE